MEEKPKPYAPRVMRDYTAELETPTKTSHDRRQKKITSGISNKFAGIFGEASKLNSEKVEELPKRNIL